MRTALFSGIKEEAVFLGGRKLLPKLTWKWELVLFINNFICRESPTRQSTSPERLQVLLQHKNKVVCYSFLKLDLLQVSQT